jgi:8-oxoguanine deaminase
VGLGVDGSASNDGSNMLAEVRQALLLNRLAHGAAALDVAGALRMATVEGARCLGRGDIGSIEPGKIANLIVTTGDPLAIPTEVRYLFIRGQLTSTDNKHRQLYEKYRKRP